MKRINIAVLAVVALVGATACDRSPTSSGGAAPRLDAGRTNPNQLALAALSRGGRVGGPSLALVAGGQAAIIDNGTVRLAVNREGHLNTGSGCEGFPPTANSGCQLGLMYIPTNTEATAPGCLCEGWGASGDDVGGYADISSGGVSNVRVISFTEDGTNAVSHVAIDRNGGGAPEPWLEVTHDYHPSPATPNLYEVRVTIKNVSDVTINDVRYTRAMDWDIGPTTFHEYVTIQGVGASNLIHSSLNGFDVPDPLRSYDDWLGGVNMNVVDAGPDDHGAVFDFAFGALAPGATKVFNIFYGAAGTEAAATATITRVHAEVYSFGQPSHGEGHFSNGCGAAGAFGECAFAADHGEPNTFIFAFGSVGGVALNTPPTPPTFGPPGFVYRGNEGSPVCLNITASDPDGDPLTYTVNWGDGATTTETSNRPCHVYRDGPAVYTGTVLVQANDGHGGTSEGTTNVSVSNVAPTIRTLKLDPRILNRPRVLQVFPISWVWADVGVLDANWSWSINWGDGSTSTGVEGLQAQINASHQYVTAGTKTLTFRLTDKDGGVVTRSIPVQVQP